MVDSPQTKLPRETKRIGKWRTATIIAVVALVVFNSNGRIISSGDTLPGALIPAALLRQGNLRLDSLVPTETYASGVLPTFLTERDGHIYSSYPVVQSLLLTPLYLPAAVALDFWHMERARLVWWCRKLEKLAASLIAAASVVWMFVLLSQRTTRQTAVSLTVVFAFGTCTWSASSQALWQHSGGVLCLIGMLHLLHLYEGEGRLAHVVLAGTLAGLAAAIRPANALVVMVVATLLVLSERRLKSASAFILPSVLLAVPVVAHNLYVFGHVLGGYAPDAVLGTQAALFESNVIVGFAGVLVSPSRGLFIYSPVLLFALCGGWMSARRCERQHRLTVWTALLYSGTHILLIASWSAWWGGWSFGPRLMLEAIPFLTLLAIPAVEAAWKRPVIKTTFVCLAFVSITVQAIGAFCYPHGRWNDYPVDISKDSSRLWDWSDNQILREASAGPYLETHERVLRYVFGG